MINIQLLIFLQQLQLQLLISPGSKLNIIIFKLSSIFFKYFSNNSSLLMSNTTTRKCDFVELGRKQKCRNLKIIQFLRNDQHITDNPTILELVEIAESSTVETSPSEAATTALEVVETTESSIVKTLPTEITTAASELVDSIVSNTATSLIITTVMVSDYCKTSTKYNIHFKNNSMTLVFTEDETTNADSLTSIMTNMDLSTIGVATIANAAHVDDNNNTLTIIFVTVLPIVSISLISIIILFKILYSRRCRARNLRYFSRNNRYYSSKTV
ncbi:unnamed protein product [Rotaria socialis]